MSRSRFIPRAAARRAAGALAALVAAFGPATTARAQGGMTFGPGYPRPALPSELRLADVLPASDPVTVRPTPFRMERGAEEAYGPFAFANGAPVVLGNARFDLQAGPDLEFSLKRQPGGAVLGPYYLEDGGEIRVGTVDLRLRRGPSYITGRVQLDGAAVTRLPVAIVRLEREAVVGLARLRIAIAEIGAERSYDTSSRVLDAPVVQGPRGPRWDPVIGRSDADVARADAAAHRKAKAAFETFLRESGARTAEVAAPRGEFAFPRLPEGRYLVCLVADLRAPDSGRVPRFEPRFWCADFTLGPFDAGETVLDSPGRPWHALYP